MDSLTHSILFFVISLVLYAWNLQWWLSVQKAERAKKGEHRSKLEILYQEHLERLTRREEQQRLAHEAVKAEFQEEARQRVETDKVFFHTLSRRHEAARQFYDEARKLSPNIEVMRTAMMEFFEAHRSLVISYDPEMQLLVDQAIADVKSTYRSHTGEDPEEEFFLQ